MRRSWFNALFSLTGLLLWSMALIDRQLLFDIRMYQGQDFPSDPVLIFGAAVFLLALIFNFRPFGSVKYMRWLWFVLGFAGFAVFFFYFSWGMQLIRVASISNSPLHRLVNKKT